MSLMPEKLMDTFRQHTDVVVDVYGFECELFIPRPAPVAQREKLDIYNEKPRLDNEAAFYPAVKTKVFIEWKPDIKRLRRLGIFTEEQIPIIAWFQNIDELTRDAYIKVDLRYIKGEWGTDEFELTESLVRNMYNAVVIQCWQMAPRRQ